MLQSYQAAGVVGGWGEVIETPLLLRILRKKNGNTCHQKLH